MADEITPAPVASPTVDACSTCSGIRWNDAARHYECRADLPVYDRLEIEGKWPAVDPNGVPCGKYAKA